jgi:hypothetical protein
LVAVAQRPAIGASTMSVSQNHRAVVADTNAIGIDTAKTAAGHELTHRAGEHLRARRLDAEEAVAQGDSVEHPVARPNSPSSRS